VGWTLVWTIKTYKKFCSAFEEYILKHMFASTKGRGFDRLNAHLLLVVILDKYHEEKKNKSSYDRSLHWVTPLDKGPIGFALKKNALISRMSHSKALHFFNTYLKKIICSM